MDERLLFGRREVGMVDVIHSRREVAPAQVVPAQVALSPMGAP